MGPLPSPLTLCTSSQGECQEADLERTRSFQGPYSQKELAHTVLRTPIRFMGRLLNLLSILIILWLSPHLICLISTRSMDALIIWATEPRPGRQLWSCWPRIFSSRSRTHSVVGPGVHGRTAVRAARSALRRWVRDVIECGAIQCDVIECDAIQCDAIEFDALECESKECDAIKCDATVMFQAIMSLASKFYTLSALLFNP